jgi:hypothetical protein
MGFPDDFVFEGSKTEIARQIGNAVPPNLAAAIARVVKAALQGPQLQPQKTNFINMVNIPADSTIAL